MESVMAIYLGGEGIIIDHASLGVHTVWQGLEVYRCC